MLSLASDDGDDLNPDYGAPVENVYMKTASALLNDDPSNLNLIYQARIGRQRGIEALPSWVPDWSTKREGMLLENALHASLALTQLGLKSFRAAGNSRLEVCIKSPSPSDPWPILVATGRIFPEVCTLAAPYLILEDSKAGQVEYNLLAQWIISLFDLVAVIRTNEPFAPNALAQTLVAGMDF